MTEDKTENTWQATEAERLEVINIIKDERALNATLSAVMSQHAAGMRLLEDRKQTLWDPIVRRCGLPRDERLHMNHETGEISLGHLPERRT